MSEAPSELSRVFGWQLNWKAILSNLVIGIAILLLVAWMMNLFLVHGVYRLVVWTTGDLTGINLYLLKAIASGAIALLLYFKKPWFEWLRGYNFRLAGLFVVLVAHNLWMYALTYSLLFRFSDGKPMKWATVTNEGIRYYASPGFGPNGQRLIEVTPDTLKKLKSWDKPLSRVDPNGVTWFNPNTGEAEIYYSETPIGNYEFFNRWGHHPQTGAELKPVSHDVKRDFDQREIELARRLQHAAKSDLERATLARQEEFRRKAATEDADRISKLRALVNRTKMDSKNVNVALVLDTRYLTGGNAVAAQAKLVSALRKLSTRVEIYDDVFRSEFGRNGYFEKAFNGDSSFLKDTGLFETASFLFLCRLKAESSVDNELGVFSSRTELTYRVFNRHGEQVDSGSIHAVGPGSSAQAALLRGIEIGVEKGGAKLIRSLESQSVPLDN
jgi:hypothetical protein